MVLIWMIKGVFYKVFFIIYKISEYADLTYYQKQREVILNRAKYYYENDKERLKRQSRDKYRNFKRREYGKNRSQNA